MFDKKKKEMTLQEVTALLEQLRLPTALVFTPLNLESEKKKFFDSDTYEPYFKYRIVKNDNEKILDKLSKVELISDVDPRISKFYIDLITSKAQANDLMYAVGNNQKVTEISKDRFGIPSPILFRNAARVMRGVVKNYHLAKSPSKTKDVLGYDEIVKVFDGVFNELGLEGWAVERSINISKNGIKIGVKRKQVLVNEEIQRSKFALRKSIVHEVGTHVLRSVNGKNTGFTALGNANLPAYLDVEEGLATWNESEMGVLTEDGLKKKAAYVYAIKIGENMSFRQLYNALLGSLPKYSAFNIVYRVKRGLADTAKPGIYTKDIVYFRGFRKVLKKLGEDKSLYPLLYAGKIDFKQCDWVREGLIPKAKIVPSKEMWNKIFTKVGI
ncbi:DUF1704 domain-containing protein [Candidatus Dojkabacteria bacterium]|jgi:hypothetical protein|nr:DUF1704 domain-containing protein [Candidatus Dojkabacteria bacterium]